MYIKNTYRMTNIIFINYIIKYNFISIIIYYTEITEENVRKDYLDIGLCFIHGKDKDGKTMFVIKCSLHTKGSKEFNQLQKLVVYWFERLER